MVLRVLTENTAADSKLTAEHGLSLYIEVNGHRVLFDFGQTAAFADNADRLGIDLSPVDLAVLSHGHYDHGGGIPTFFGKNRSAPVYVSAHAFGSHFNGTDKYIGLDPTLDSHPRLRRIDRPTRIGDGLTVLDASCCPMTYPADAYGLTIHTERGIAPDPFEHEQCLLIETNGHRILIAGCSHRGVLNWMDAVHPDIVIGGFHFMKLDPNGDGADTLANAADVLCASGCRFITGHCTGDGAFRYLKQRLGDRLQPLSTGAIFQLP